MGNYIKNQRVDRVQIVEKTVEKSIEQPQTPQISINVEDLANALSKVLNINVGNQNNTNQYNTKLYNRDSFDESKTLEQLANSMIVQRGNNESNFEDLGDVHKTKKDNKETDKTIDLLSDLDD